ncbi:MAG: hypothetical protein EAZ97_10010 [Bacteroidetes bacterium]|nr:MAG: hypothetical protein EAZ97_10010 [Bacteroidota bacterium]
MFSEFATQQKSNWYNKVIKELKGGGFDEKLLWKVPEGVFEPLYTCTETENLAYLADFQKSNTWRNCQYIKVLDEKSANKEALEALNNGTDEILFDLCQNVTSNLEILLQDILLPYCAISWQISQNPESFLDSYFGYAVQKNYSLETLTGGLQLFNNQDFKIENLILKSKQAPNFTILSLTSSKTDLSDFVADVLAQANFWIENLANSGIEKSQIIQKIQFKITLENRFFLEIARLKSLRILFVELAEFHLEKNIESVNIFAQTTFDLSQNDPNWNLLSNNNQAMAGILGGCQSLCVMPHDAEKAVFSSRIARNVSNILKEESYFDKVYDPTAGAYYIDKLTDSLAESAWEKFKNLI